MKKLILAFLAVLLAGVFVSCDSEIKIVTTGNSTEITFSGAAEEGYKKLIKSVSPDGGDFIQTEEISKELQANGFKNVNVSQKMGTDLTISAVPEASSNFLFTSGILKQEGKLWVPDFSSDTLVAFYNSSNQQITQFLDLLIAPVFNEEEMDIDEYLQVIAAFYGDSVAEELRTSKVTVTCINGDSKYKKSYSLVKILCGIPE